MITRIVVTLGRVFNEIPRYPAIYITPCIDIEAFIKGTWVGDEFRIIRFIVSCLPRHILLGVF